jgi:membrane-bound lytic murein transglycosylase D
MDGDWALALAAYNAGIGRVKGAIRKNRGEGQPLDYASLELPRETRHYLPRLLALAAIVADPQRFDVTIPGIPDEPYLAEVPLDSMLDLGVAAALSGIDQAELHRLNPGVRGSLLDPKLVKRLVLPIDKRERFVRKLAELPPQQRYQELAQYRVKDGDTLGHIAQRTGASLALIRRANGLRGDRLQIGQLLVIPPGEGAGDGLSQADARGEAAMVHVVEKGDSLWTVARKYRVGYKKLADWNGLSARSVLRPGQELEIRI